MTFNRRGRARARIGNFKFQLRPSLLFSKLLFSICGVVSYRINNKQSTVHSTTNHQLHFVPAINWIYSHEKGSKRNQFDYLATKSLFCLYNQVESKDATSPTPTSRVQGKHILPVFIFVCFFILYQSFLDRLSCSVTHSLEKPRL